MFRRNASVSVAMVLLLILSGCGCMMGRMMPKMKSMMFRVHQSRMGFDETVSVLTETFENHPNWVLMNVYDNRERYRGEGELGPFKVLEICKPGVAFKILSQDQDKTMAAMIPLKVCIFQQEDSNTYVSMMNTRQMSRMFKEAVIREDLLQAATELDAVLANIIAEK